MRRLGVLVAGSVLGVASLSACMPVKGPPQSVNFSCTSALQTWTVPAGVHFITATLFGAEGGDSELFSSTFFTRGGRGGGAIATLAVNPGETLHILVGCEGESTAEPDPNADFGAGGFGGGGNGGTDFGAGGGGATMLARPGELLLAAGGGGGAGAGINGDPFSVGGDGGGSSGTPGGPGSSSVTGGGGGTATTGGAAGTGGACVNPPTAGSLGLGGDGCDRTGLQPSGGGGGGGYYGGGGGSGDGVGAPAGGGGGGGSGFGPAGATLATGAWGFGGGIAVITYRTSG